MYSFIKFSSMMTQLLMGMTVLMLQMLLVLQTSVAEVEVSVNPVQIEMGLSPSLDVNCTFSAGSTGMAAIVTLTVSRENSSELASITTISNHQVNVISSEGITADGVINQGGESYVHLHWDDPTDTQKRAYKCVARGIDVIGHSIESVNISTVSVNQPDLQALVDELKQMKHIQTSLYQDVQQMQTHINELEIKVENLTDLSVFIFPPLSYKNKRYCVSKAAYQDISDAMTVCKANDGILAEMDDTDEYHAVQNYIESLHGVHYVFIGGTDEGHDARWVLPSSNQDMPIVDWHGSNPSIGDVFNCVRLVRGYDWMMSSWYCHEDSPSDTSRYMCELSHA